MAAPEPPTVWIEQEQARSSSLRKWGSWNAYPSHQLDYSDSILPAYKYHKVRALQMPGEPPLPLLARKAEQSKAEENRAARKGETQQERVLLLCLKYYRGSSRLSRSDRRRTMASSLLHCSDKLPFMNVETILHMKEGLDETSYAQNSSLQKRGMDTLKSLIVNSATDVYISQMPDRFTVADLGCSSGPNALCLVEDIVGSIGKICNRSTRQPPPEFSVLLNDLPTNDFNTIFFSLPEFTDRLKSAAKSDEWGRPMVFLSGVPGSFYGRLFPRKSVHFICSCSSLHWLSQVPPGLFDESTNRPVNKGKMYISSTSPATVPLAYLRQFQRDFNLFLKSRAAEVLAGGRMVLAMLGRQTNGGYIDRRTTFLWELLSESFASLVSQGLVEQDRVDAYNVPFYAPSLQEIEEEVRREGSFTLDYVQTYEINLSSSGDAKEDGRTVAMAIRAIQESMLSHHFGPEIVDALFHKYTDLVTESMEREQVKSVQIGVVLTRL